MAVADVLEQSKKCFFLIFEHLATAQRSWLRTSFMYDHMLCLYVFSQAKPPR